jgi:hypothetical protein
LAVSEQPATMQVWVMNESQNAASPAQSAGPAQEAPRPSNVRQYGWDSHVAHVYAALQSSLLPHAFVQVPAVPPLLIAQNEYVVSVHGAVVALQGSPSPATATQTLSALLVCPAAHAHFPPEGTSSGAHA